MKTILKEPGKYPVRKNVSNDLRALQDVVGGYIETVTLFSDVTFICNEEGRLLGMAPNFKFYGVDFVGPVLIVGVKGEEFCDIPEEHAAFLMEELTKAEEKARREWK